MVASTSTGDRWDKVNKLTKNLTKLPLKLFVAFVSALLSLLGSIFALRLFDWMYVNFLRGPWGG